MSASHPQTMTHEKKVPVEPRAHGVALDSPLRTMFGLLILWGSLVLIFAAHRMSDPFIRLDVPGGGNTASQTAALSQWLGPRDVLMQPFQIYLPKDTPRNALKNVAAIIKFDLYEDNLKKLLSKQPRAYEFKSKPLCKAIHALIDNPGVGYAIQGKTIRLFEQKLEDPGMGLHRQMLNWEAELELSDEPLLIFPSGNTDLWFSVQMIRDLNRPENPWRTMQVELWQGAELKNTSRQTLDDQGKGIISMSTQENIIFQIKRTAQPKGAQTPGRYNMIFNYQSFE